MQQSIVLAKGFFLAGSAESRGSPAAGSRQFAKVTSSFWFLTIAPRMVSTAAWEHTLAPTLTRIGSTHNWLNSTLVYPSLSVPRRH